MRKRRPEAMGSLDSLLDTMTNAVGILIVVVAVTQLNVADTVRQIQALANLKSLQVEAAKEALKERHRMEKLIDRISMYWGSLDTYMVLPEGVTVEDIKRLIPDLEMVAEDPSVLPPRNDVPLLTEVMQAEIQVAEAQKKLDEQKAAMDYRERQSKPIRDLSLPVVRSVNNLRPLIFFCRNGNIYPFDADGLVKIFNNAVREHLEITTPRLEIQTADFPRLELHFATNVIGSFLCSREAIRRMSTRHGGRGGAIVNVSSAASRLGSPNEYVDYAAAKGAVDTFTLGLAREVASDGIRVNAVRPGVIYTEIHASGGEPDRVERVKTAVPMQRGGEADEVARTILWLLSEEASYCTGALLDVSGGR